jgi:hypothetical protein
MTIKGMRTTNDYIYQIVSYLNENLLEQYKYYKYDYARLGIFLTSYNRLKMTELLYPHNEHIHRFHTDGAILSKQIDLDIGANLGQWKIDKGPMNCVIKNSNIVEWGAVNAK